MPDDCWTTGPYVLAHVWTCGDEVCQCTQPMIERISPNRDAGPPWIRREILWDGTFHSGADREEIVAQVEELVEACKSFPEARGVDAVRRIYHVPVVHSEGRR